MFSSGAFLAMKAGSAPPRASPDPRNGNNAT